MRAARILVALATLTLTTVTPLWSADLGGVIVQEHDGVVRVMARFVVPQAPQEVLRVLTDYERIPGYMPDVKVSIVRRRSEGYALVEQEAQKRLLMFSKRVRLLLQVHETADAVVFEDAAGESFSTYEGSWHVAVVDGQTQVSYQLVARPAFDVPSFVLVRLLRKDAADLVDRLRGEIAARAMAGGLH